MTSLSIWFSGARPRTWPAAVVPVLVGTAAVQDKPDLLRALLALVVGLALQIAVNYANDYSDGVRGTDDQRVGPQRLVASGVVPPRSVKRLSLIHI